MAAKVVAIIAAAGSGERFGSPKALVKIGGKTLLERVLSTFCGSLLFQSIIVICRNSEKQEIAEVVGAFENKISGAKIHLVGGGETRQESVWCGLDYLQKSDPESSNSFVLIHDVARPLVTKDLIEVCISKAEAKGAVTAAIPTSDTLIEVKPFVAETSLYLNRENVWSVQTPQVFPFQMIFAAHQKAKTMKLQTTDDASLALWQGNSVTVVEGSISNVKLTRPADLMLLEALSLSAKN